MGTVASQVALSHPTNLTLGGQGWGGNLIQGKLGGPRLLPLSLAEIAV